MGDRRYGRRQALVAGASGLAALSAGCLGVFESDSGPDLSTVAFEFTYERTQSGGTVTIEHAGGDAIRAGDLQVTTSDGDEAVWSALGSTVEREDDTVGPGSTARIGADVLNWPSAVPPGELVRVVYVASEQSVTELARYTEPTSTPTASPTATPTSTATPTPVPGQSITGFESGDLSDWTVVGVGETGAGEWSVESTDPFEGEYAATYRGDRRRVIASMTPSNQYPSRGDVFTLRHLYTDPKSGGGFGWGVPSGGSDSGYRVQLRHTDWSSGPDTMRLRVRTGDADTEIEDVAVTGFDVSEYTGEYLRWEVAWGDPTIRVTAYGADGEEIATLAAEDTTFDDGGVALSGNSSDGTTVRFDALRVIPDGV